MSLLNRGLLGALCAMLACCAPMAGAQSVVNFESPHVHPIDLSPNGNLLAVCNTIDNRVEIFNVTQATPKHVGSVPVGYDPVSVRFRTNTELWAVNLISDTVSIIDVPARNVTRSVQTLDEPCDVAFAGSPQRAFVTCSSVNTIQVFNPADLDAAGTAVVVDAEDPRALAVSPDGTKVYAAIYESGNKTTLLMGSSLEDGTITFPNNVTDDADTPHGGMTPHFNGEGVFIPAKNAGNGTPPKASLIVRQDAGGKWRDDTGADWTEWVSGTKANLSSRPQGWTLLDHDIAVIDANSLAVSYIDGLMNINMAIGVNPSSGTVSVVGTEARNELRFEPIVNGIFVQSHLALANPDTLTSDAILDLNPHLDYSTPNIAFSERVKSLGDPRAIVWSADGSRAFVAGMGSNNLVVIDASGARAGLSDTIEVGEGPTGLSLNNNTGRLYVLNRFAATLSVVDTATEAVLAEVGFFDPTPSVIKVGRRHLFDTHATSGLGQVSCASCHVDARMDRLAWDLGDPSGATKALNDLNLGMNNPLINTGFEPFHPMKGPWSRRRCRTSSATNHCTGAATASASRNSTRHSRASWARMVRSPARRCRSSRTIWQPFTSHRTRTATWTTRCRHP